MASSYVYMYTCHEEEAQLCQLELRSLFGMESSSSREHRIHLTESNLGANYVISPIRIDPSRSPFIKLRLAVSLAADTVQVLASAVNAIELQDASFKVVYADIDKSINYNEQRLIEREVGACIRGKAEMRYPDRLFGITRLDGRWLFGECVTNEAVWLKHNTKPQHYSTALSTRMARAVANIAVPFPEGMTAIDPCCGIGTVLIEALSMGIHMIGTDINPLAVRGARVNLAHFGFPDAVAIQDMRTLTGSYDAAVLDMPYNLCSVISPAEQLSMLESLRGLTTKAVIVTTETIDELVIQAGFTISDRCVVRKGSFSRQVLVCK
ncbi:TRM11 family methyltransferase [Paenibacillus sp. 1_12]|uniref:TRM11 family SAM-dependent methyltransferase n=1 Tax=Paenibacillus sp. 1_12 TaxID=1566278 RepID=UPI00210D5EDD|nr:RsmD family RNA methyltransferase [Paenibacillus sp. 1_12]